MRFERNRSPSQARSINILLVLTKTVQQSGFVRKTNECVHILRIIREIIYACAAVPAIVSGEGDKLESELPFAAERAFFRKKDEKQNKSI